MNPEKANIVTVLKLFLDLLDIPVTRSTIVTEVNKHPDFGSLLAISELLTNWKTNNEAYELDHKELLGLELDEPFITCLKSGGGEFVLVHQINKHEVIVSNERLKRYSFSIDRFKDLYTGAILVAEKNANSGESAYAINRRKEVIENYRTPAVVFLTIILVLSFLFQHYSAKELLQARYLSFLLLNLVGVSITGVLLLQTIHADDPLINRLCGGGKVVSCKDILSSNASKINSYLSWSEAGFFYFAGNITVMLIAYGRNDMLPLLTLISVATLPYTFYSIFYQWRIARKWCTLCCIVQLLLWLNFLVLMPFFEFPIAQISIPALGTIMEGALIPVLGWIFIKPYLRQRQQIEELQGLFKFKYNSAMFERLLANTPNFPLLADEHCIILGNPDATVTVTMISKPYCKPCSKAHAALDEWLEIRSDIKVQIILLEAKKEMLDHLMTLKQSDVPAMKKAVSNWYNQQRKDLRKWLLFNPAPTHVSHETAFRLQAEWCELTQTEATPAFFINGSRIPKSYQIEDIKYFI